MPSSKDGFMSPFPIITPRFLASLGSSERVKCAKINEAIIKIIDDLDVMERQSRVSEIKSLYGQLLNELNTAAQTSRRISIELASRDR